jgi:Cu-Zn family superoxide dismutase
MRKAIFLLLVAGAACGGSQKSAGIPSAAIPNEIVAEAKVQPLAGQSANGTVTFRQVPGGPVTIQVALSGLAPSSKHAFHVHENGDCGGEFAANAGKHFNPAGAPHPQHPGDFGNLTAGADGTVATVVTGTAITLEDGPTSVMNRAVVIHGGEDDLVSQPSGNAGKPIACGIIAKK